MVRETGFTSPLRLFSENPVEVLKRLRDGYIDYLGGAEDQFTDLHVLYALKSGLIDECARAFPEPRYDPEIPIRVLLTACVAGALAGEYALCQAGPALHSPAVLSELGYNVAWLSPGEGLSRRGTQEEALFHSDTLRKLLLKIAEADCAMGGRPGESLIRWWNETVGPALLRRAGGGTGAWILDCTKLVVNLDNPRYEGSEVTKDDDGAVFRGYKLALLSSLIDTGRVIVRIGWDSARPADITVARPLLEGETPLGAGDTLLHDRGLNDGPRVSCLKRDLDVDSVFGLKKDYLSYGYAVARAVVRSDSHWKAHPTREKQEILLVRDIGEVWDTLTVPINGCVVRQRDEKEADGYKYWVFGTTNLERSARGIIRDYEARSECEEDHRQVKGPNWEMDELMSTRLVEIVFHVLMVLWAYNLCQVYGQTAAGERFAGKTKRARQRELRRERGARVVVIAGPYYAVLEELDVAEVLLEIEGEAKERLRGTVKHLKAARRVGKRVA
jgi:Transposase DDE domain